MGKLLDAMWEEFQEKIGDSEELSELIDFIKSVKELTKELSPEKQAELEKSIFSFNSHNKLLQKEAFTEGVRQGCLMMLEKL